MEEDEQPAEITCSGGITIPLITPLIPGEEGDPE
jgi:hypothetical protein